MPDGGPGFPCAGGPPGEYQFVLPQRREISILRRVARPDHAAPAGLDMAERLPSGIEFAGKQGPLESGLLDDAFDVALAGGLPELGALVERFEHATGLLAGVLGAADQDLMAGGVGVHAEAALDAGNILVVMAEHDGGQTIVVERERHLDRRP